MNGLIFMIDLMQKSSNLTLRQLEKMLGLLSIIVQSFSKSKNANPMCILFLIHHKVKGEDKFYEKFVNRKLQLQELLDKTIDMFYPLGDEKMLNYFVWFQAEIVLHYYQYLKEIDNEVVLYEGDQFKDDFKIVLKNKADRDYINLKDNLRSLLCKPSFFRRVNLISSLLPHIELTKIAP